MTRLKDVSSVWKNIKEIDLKPIRESATHPIKIALVGSEGSGRHTLAENMRTDPARAGMYTQTPLVILPADESLEMPEAHLIILLVDATRADIARERELVKNWSNAGKNVLVLINKANQTDNNIEGDILLGWRTGRVIYGAADDSDYLQTEFVPTILEMLPQAQIALGRQFPLFRTSQGSLSMRLVFRMPHMLSVRG